MLTQKHKETLNRKLFGPLIKVDTLYPSLFLNRCGLQKPKFISKNKEVSPQATTGFKDQRVFVEKKKNRKKQFDIDQKKSNILKKRASGKSSFFSQNYAAQGLMPVLLQYLTQDLQNYKVLK